MNTTSSQQKTNYLKQIVTGIVYIAIAVLVWQVIPEPFFKYVFFLRAPIFWGLLLVALPLIATFVLPNMLKNLFVLRGLWQLIFVIVSANMAAIGVMINFYMIFNNVPARFGLSPLEISNIWQYWLAIALSLPICITSYQLSKQEIQKNKLNLAVIIGSVLSLGLLWVVTWTRSWIFDNFAGNQLLIDFIKFITRNKTDGYLNPETQQLLEYHLGNIAFFLVAFVIYCVIGLIFKPKPQPNQKEAAALTYLMIIIMMVAPLSGSLTFYFDYYRVLAFLLFVIIGALMYALFRVDHFFELTTSTHFAKDDFKEAIDERLKYQEGKPRTLVVVCASGGGIQAAGWTVQVLTGLQQLLTESFTKAIGFVSSVSGGSVGTMYYLDRFSAEGYPEPNVLADIFNSATEDSLDAVGWGLAYPDLWRIIGIPFLAPQTCDRGVALVTDWQRELKDPQTIKYLATWSQQIFQGEIPIPIFNATLVEDGRRFLISPMTFGESQKSKSIDFKTLYQGYDIDIVTAARLSATYSYVSPICRNLGENQKGNYHIADGGYFDNSGVVTMVEWLNEWLEPQKELNIERVLLLQINAFPESPESANSNSQSKGNEGWFQAIIGPLLTLFKVRDTTQISRIDTEVELLRQKWDSKVEIAYCPIFFPNNSTYQPPLSWKLTAKEKKEIQDGWNSIVQSGISIRKADGSTDKTIQDLWKDWGF